VDAEPPSGLPRVRAVLRVLLQGGVILAGALALWLIGGVPGTDLSLPQETLRPPTAIPASGALLPSLTPFSTLTVPSPPVRATSTAEPEGVLVVPSPTLPIAQSVQSSPTAMPGPTARDGAGQDAPVATYGDPPVALTTPTEAVSGERSPAEEPVPAGGAALPQGPSTEVSPGTEGVDVGIVVDGIFVPFIPSLAPPSSVLDAAAAAGQWVWPVRGEISQGYSSGHRAIDISTGHGAVVLAADAGTVVYARWESSGYGYLVIVDHHNGFVSYYAHLYGFYIDAGQEVARGEQIGELGSTGHSTGPHLHFEIRQNGVQRDPQDLLP
jgi:hypothetical protein